MYYEVWLQDMKEFDEAVELVQRVHPSHVLDLVARIDQVADEEGMARTNLFHREIMAQQIAIEIVEIAKKYGKEVASAELRNIKDTELLIEVRDELLRMQARAKP